MCMCSLCSLLHSVAWAKLYPEFAVCQAKIFFATRDGRHAHNPKIFDISDSNAAEYRLIETLIKARHRKWGRSCGTDKHG